MQLPILWELEFWEECAQALLSDSIIEQLTDQEFFDTWDIIKYQYDRAAMLYSFQLTNHLLQLRRSAYVHT